MEGILDEIRVEPYDAAWPARFAAEREFILRCFAEHPIVIEHIGSTAVPGLAAKPIIDVLVLVDDLAFGHTAIPALEAGGYSFARSSNGMSRSVTACGPTRRQGRPMKR
jgi:GrpB-like predicted nucleotidyltransferase (UPF0157 family)